MLSNQELALVSGGAIKWTIGIVLGAIGAFLALFVDITRPVLLREFPEASFQSLGA